MRKHRKEQMVAAAFALFLAVAAASCSKPKDVEASKPVEPASATANQIPAIRTAKAETRSISASVQATGSFVAKESSDVAPLAPGRVSETPVDVGAFVQQGQIIARLEDQDLKLRLEQVTAAEQQAEAALRQAQSRIGLGQGEQFNPANVPEVLSAKATYDSAQAQAKQAEADARRYENLIQTGDVSRTAFEKARTQADTAQAQANSARQQYEATLNSARQNYQGVINAQASLAGMKAQTALAKKAVEDTIVRAPYAGYVSARPIAVGQHVALTNKIATVLRISPIKLELQVPEVNAAQMKVGVTVEAEVPGYPGRTFLGRATAINPAIDPASRSMTVVAEFANSDLALKPGMFATGRIRLPGSSMGIFVPQQAVLTDPSTNSSQVFFIRDGKARVAVVQLGERDGSLVRVLSGIADGMTVALDHLNDLYDGQSVKLTGGGN